MRPGIEPPISTTEPNSPMARAKARPPPLMMAGARVGNTMRRNVVRLLAPSEAAACSTSASASISTGCTARTTNGRVTKASATITPGCVALRCTLIGLCGPYSDNMTMLATMVGNANGRSISALTTLLPGKSSRTSTQAMRVPMTTLISATTTETTIVTRNASTAPGAVTASQKPLQPSSKEWKVNAANGSSTMMLSHNAAVETPSGPTEPLTRNQERSRVRNGDGGLLPASAPALVLGALTISSPCRKWSRYCRIRERTVPCRPVSSRPDPQSSTGCAAAGTRR